MPSLKTDAELLGAGLVVVVLGAWYLQSRLTNVAAGVVGAVADVGAGVAIGVGDVLGLPRTDLTECERAIAEGRTWDASFVCPAGTFIRSVFD